MPRDQQAELKQQLADKTAAGVRAVVDAAVALSSEPQLQALEAAAQQLAAREAAIERTSATLRALPLALARLDAACAVALHHASELSAAVERRGSEPATPPPAPAARLPS